MVEFAIVLPVLLMLIFGMIELSILLYDKAMITNASREAARYGVVFRSPKLTKDDLYDQVKKVAEDYCLGSLISFNGIKIPDVPNDDFQVDVDPDDNTVGISGTPLKVKVKYDYQFLIFPNLMELIKGSFTNKITLEAKTTMQFE